MRALGWYLQIAEMTYGPDSRATEYLRDRIAALGKDDDVVWSSTQMKFFLDCLHTSGTHNLFGSRENELRSLRQELARTFNQFMINLLRPRIAYLEEILRYDVWYVPTALSSDKPSCVLLYMTSDEADEFIYFGHADEPSPDRADYWSYIKLPTGSVPK